MALIAIKAVAAVIIGAIINTGLEAFAGITSSLVKSLIPSANTCNKP